MKITIPESIDAGAMLDQAELRCVGGACSSFALETRPTLASDQKSASARFKAWGSSSTWRLTAKVLISSPSAASKLVLDPIQNVGRIVAVTQELVSVVSDKPARLRPTIEQDQSLIQILSALESDNTPVRRNARVALANLLSTAEPDVVAQLIKRIPTSSYRFQVGLTTALSKMPNGWIATDPLAKGILVSLIESPKVEVSLKANAKAAIKNLAHFAYYEAPSAASMKELRALGARNPYPPPDRLERNAKLQATTSIYLRAGPRTDANVLRTLDQNECIRVIEVDRKTETGAWMKVALTDCKG
jgi:hypothetical protein